ncbi:hypothetical protein L596_006530 [Steinernema carpocapsae]|uniref:Uncharacterized protein n=1 Tax=Steinernema carpocapsae TaxID=34508 RepID=A0A4U8VB18_STECR|nr:hypothetical protein L596_006530 [Steinernema carpocapsae]
MYTSRRKPLCVCLPRRSDDSCNFFGERRLSRERARRATLSVGWSPAAAGGGVADRPLTGGGDNGAPAVRERRARERTKKKKTGGENIIFVVDSGGAV